jgi:hypothetical protein
LVYIFGKINIEWKIVILGAVKVDKGGTLKIQTIPLGPPLVYL